MLKKILPLLIIFISSLYLCDNIESHDKLLAQYSKSDITCNLWGYPSICEPSFLDIVSASVNIYHNSITSEINLAKLPDSLLFNHKGNCYISGSPQPEYLWKIDFLDNLGRTIFSIQLCHYFDPTNPDKIASVIEQTEARFVKSDTTFIFPVSNNDPVFKTVISRNKIQFSLTARDGLLPVGIEKAGVEVTTNYCGDSLFVQGQELTLNPYWSEQTLYKKENKSGGGKKSAQEIGAQGQTQATNPPRPGEYAANCKSTLR